MNKAKANPAKLVPLKDQAAYSITQAARLIEQNTRPCSGRRRILMAKLAEARTAYRAGQYATARDTARAARLGM